jgi:hypothetical protein
MVPVIDAPASNSISPAEAGELMRVASALRIRATRKEYSGIILSLAKQETPDTSGYDDPEIVYRVKKHHHAGLIVRAKKLERVLELLDQYAQRFVEDFEAVLPPLEKAE